MTDLPVIMTAAGAQPTPPATLLASLIAGVTQTNPGFTANLPGSLIEDVTSTQVAGLATMDSARVEAINDVSPAGANDFVLYQLGQIYIGEPGGAPGTPTNTSVSVVFTALDPNTSAPINGLVVPQGFVVSDGTYQYVVQDDGVTDASGLTPALFCLATIPGQWAVSSGTVTQLVTSEPTGVNLTCSNPNPGTAGNAAETSEQYRARVFQAGQAVSTGTTTLLKTLLGNVSGVQQRLISVRQSGSAWEVIVGGGDPYEVAGAVFESGLNIAGLVGSTINVTNISSANPGVVTTDKNHGYATGANVTMTGIIGPTVLNGVPHVVTVISEKTFSIPVDTTLLPAYVSGGVCSPNLRNVSVNISDPPDVYGVTFVSPPQQTVTMAVQWNTTQPNFASQAAVAQLAASAITAYVNSILVAGPISVAILTQTFIDAVSSILDPETISVLTFAVSINGVSSPPTGQLIVGDPESYFFTTTSNIAVSQS